MVCHFVVCTKVRCAILCIGFGKSVMEFATAQRLLVSSQSSLVGAVFHLAPSALQLKADIVLGTELVRKHRYIAEAFERCSRDLPKSKWICRKHVSAEQTPSDSVAAVAKAKAKAKAKAANVSSSICVETLEDSASICKNFRRLRANHGLDGKFFAKPAMSAL